MELEINGSALSVNGTFLMDLPTEADDKDIEDISSSLTSKWKFIGLNIDSTNTNTNITLFFDNSGV